MKPLLQWPAVALVNLPEAADAVLKTLASKDIRVLALDGTMGAGKTTFVRAMAEVLGVGAEVSSPTFGLVNTYLSSAGERIHHMDWYRVEDESELWDAGIPELLESGQMCWVEWPERGAAVFPAHSAVLTIDVAAGEDKRSLSLFSA